MGLTDELLKLEDLHRRGALDDDEFARAKTALLDVSTPSDVDPSREQVPDHLAGILHQQELARIDREWAMEREHYLVADRHGRRYVPTTSMGVGAVVLGGGFGILWTIMATAITSAAPDVGPFAVARVVFPLFGLLFALSSVGWGFNSLFRARAYHAAYCAYQTQREPTANEHVLE